MLDEEDKNNYLADMYYDSGLDKNTFQKIYVSTLDLYCKKYPHQEGDLVVKLRDALRARRYIYLPSNVEAEDVHLYRDVWTFAVFLSGLMFDAKDDVANVLEKILSKPLLSWLRDKGVESALVQLHDPESDDYDVNALRRFYVKPVTSDVIEEVIASEGDAELLNNEDIPTPKTNKNKGEEFLLWVDSHIKKERLFAYVENDQVYIQSPVAFSEFEKVSGYAWAGVQKGLYKVGGYEYNEKGTVFHRVNKKNVIVYTVNNFEEKINKIKESSSV